MASVVGSGGGHSALVNRFLNIVQHPIPQRCQEVAQLLQEANIKDVQSIFPVLVENIFGFGANMEWGLKTTLRSSQPREFHALRAFLAPDGPLLRLTYKLLGDGFLRYEFPVYCLPAPSRQMLEEGVIPYLYVNKLQCSGPGSVQPSLFLNAYEFYFFHFVYFALNPVHQRNAASNVNPNEVLYLNLLESYLSYFLPVDGNTIPPISIHPSVISGWQSFSSLLPGSISSFIGLTPASSPGTSGSPVGHSTKPNPMQQRTSSQLLKISANTVGFSPQHAGASGNTDNYQMELWRTETLILILVEFLLNQASNESSWSFSSSVVRPQQLPPDVFERLFADKFVPSQFHMGIVRVLVKHLHYFANSAISPSMTSPYPYGPHSAMEELKSSVIPQLFQKKLYTFLRLSFDRWPMDASFRLPLETWLSYIQPWRYTLKPLDYNQGDGKDQEDRECALEPKWQQFVSENLLFYTVIFQQLLPRFFRMELASPKNAYLLFRVTKVFSQANLGEMIRDVESHFLESLGPSQSSHSQQFGLKSNLFTPPSLRATRDQASVGGLYQQMLELEGSNFVYAPLFGKEVQTQITRLLTVVVQAREANANLLMAQQPSSSGWLSYLFDFGSGSSSEDEYTVAERRKVDTHLGNANQQLIRLFKLPETPPSVSTPTTTDQSYLHTPRPSQAFEETAPSGDSGLSPIQRHRLINGISRSAVLYHGNPDTQPIRSYEVAFLVRMLYQISTYLTENYGREIQALYHRHGFLGAMCRQILAGPTVYYETTKDGTRSYHTAKTLPPRVDLRFLASQQTIGYLVGICLFAYAWGIGPVTCIFLLCAIFVIYAALKALVKLFFSKDEVTPPRRQGLLEQEFH